MKNVRRENNAGLLVIKPIMYETCLEIIRK